MRVSLSVIKQFIDVDLPIDELVQRINQQLGGVEAVIDLGVRYKNAVIVHVVEAEQHPNADRLRVCKVDDGGATADVPRDDNGYVQVVCGAPNAQAGMYAVWLPPETTVPASVGTDEPFMLGARELRGVMSQGMLAAADELGIGTDHSGIVEISPSEWTPNGQEVRPGARFATVYGLDDYAIDIENKMFTHRPDCFGHLGVAREIAGILHKQFTSPNWYIAQPSFQPAEGLDLTVRNDSSDKVKRFMAVAIKDITVKQSPLWLQCALVAMGAKPINNIVDVTNYIMLLTAQPTHAYDYDKLRGNQLIARMANAGETIDLLNGKTYELHDDDIVIADSDGAVGLAGIMGGKNSEVSHETKNIVLEVANFDMYAVRRSSMRHGIFTDALTRFNKGQSPLQNDHIMQLLMTSINDVAGGNQATIVTDSNYSEVNEPVQVTADFINKRLGLTLDNADVTRLLENVEVAVDSPDDHDTYLEVVPPFWRTDIELAEDVVEEVGRLYGFDKLPRELPQRSMTPVPVNLTVQAKQLVRNSLTRAGLNEVLTYSFVHERVITQSEQNVAMAFRLGNALSPDLQYYRLSVTPSLLDKIHMNSKAGHGEFALYEIGKAHHKSEFDDDGLPREFQRVAAVYVSKQADDSAAYFRAKRIVEQMMADFGVHDGVRYQKLTEFDFGEHDALRQLTAPFDPERSSMVWRGDRFYGVIGEYKQSVASRFKLPQYCAGFELFVSLFEELAQTTRPYQALSRYPSVSQDISLQVSDTTSYDQLYNVVNQAIAERHDDAMRVEITPLTIYQPDAGASKTITFRVTVTSLDRTLRDNDVKPLLEHAAAEALSSLNAVLV